MLTNTNTPITYTKSISNRDVLADLRSACSLEVRCCPFTSHLGAMQPLLQRVLSDEIDFDLKAKLYLLSNYAQ